MITKYLRDCRKHCHVITLSYYLLSNNELVTNYKTTPHLSLFPCTFYFCCFLSKVYIFEVFNTDWTATIVQTSLSLFWTMCL